MKTLREKLALETYDEFVKSANRMTFMDIPVNELSLESLRVALVIQANINKSLQGDFEALFKFK